MDWYFFFESCVLIIQLPHRLLDLTWRHTFLSLPRIAAQLTPVTITVLIAATNTLFKRQGVCY
jgi:hypothetical protein